MIRIVLDTNIIISGIFWKGKPYQILKNGIQGKYQIVLSIAILKGLEDRLIQKFKLPEEKIEDLINLLLYFCHFVKPTIKLKVVKEDPQDNKIIECALTGGAKYIVTGDSHLLKLKQVQKVKIVNASKFLSLKKLNR